MQTLRKKTSPLKYRNEPARFFGDGVIFKAKLIGILEVGEARGDRMCQEALQDLKMAIRAAGEHKQRITIHVTIEGLRLRDEKTGESLYHHPVHKISFIAQDMTDSRAFGYIFGSPDCGHRFFGIKTDKAASQVVLAMRDLFQCVFELKKKEIELAKQHIQSRISSSHDHQSSKSSLHDAKKNSSLLSEASSKPSKVEKSPETTANLVDLEQELSSIQRGITQMERITPSEESGPMSGKSVFDDDPFGDSFTSFSPTPFNILPPPASSKRGVQASSKQSDELAELSQIMSKATTPPIPPFPSSSSTNNSNNADWQRPASSSIFEDEPQADNSSSNTFADDSTINANFKSPINEITGAFSDLDPLGTGKNKPYVDKKFFFQDLKNPPKKLLRDLSEPESIFDAHFSPMKTPRPTSRGNADANSSSLFESSTKTTDPFDEEDFSKIYVEPFEASSKPSVSPKSIILPDTKISTLAADEKSSSSTRDEDKEKNSFENHHDTSWSSSTFSDPKRYERQPSDASSRSSNVFSVDSFSKKLPPMSNLFGQRNVKRDSNGINMRRLQESDSMSENEPELPPRPEIGSQNDPPPLPPKAGQTTYTDRYGRTTSYSRYDYASKYKPTHQSTDSPPLPLPSRKINRPEVSAAYVSTSTIATSRYRKPPSAAGDEDDYLQPSEIPTILPPPQKKDPSKLRGSQRKSETDPKSLDAPTPTISSVPLDMPPQLLAPILPDITLSQLLTLGVDDLAQKLNVPVSKLSTMTIVELTKYLSEFIEKSKIQKEPSPPINDSPVFKVNFDDAESLFVAKFDDDFGETKQQQDNTFVANFDNFNQAPVSVIPTADRYAVFREMIDQDIQQSTDLFHHQESIESNNSNSLEDVVQPSSMTDFQRELEKPFSPAFEQFRPSPSSLPAAAARIDTTITEAISNAKDRYAALRDLVLVEDLFDKSAIPPLASISDSNLSDDIEEEADHAFDTAEVAGDNNSLDNVPTYSVSWADAEALPDATCEEEQQQDDQNSLQIGSVSNKDDFEIDEYMKKAISELSLDQRLSPNIQNKSPATTAAGKQQPSPSPTNQLRKPSPCLNDMSTSPIPLAPKSPSIREETVEEAAEEQQNENQSAEVDREKTITPPVEAGKQPTESTNVDANESWAVFTDENPASSAVSASAPPTSMSKEKSSTPTNNLQSSSTVVSGKPPTGKESPVSSEGKNNELKQREKEYQRKWPKHHTSSSSRDVSPWDEEGPASTGDYRRRPRPTHHDAHHSTTAGERYARPPQTRRRMNSCDEDYDEEYERRHPQQRSRGYSGGSSSKGSVHRSREILNSGENPNWRYPPEHAGGWSDDDDEERMDRSQQRHFDRTTLRSTYGPPYDKREPKSLPYDRRAVPHDKRSKYYRPGRGGGEPPYDYDPYDVPPSAPRGKSRKDFDDYEAGAFERGSRESRSAREFFYGRAERGSFDSNESYESGRGHRMGSGELYGSFESRSGDYRERERYFAAAQGRVRRAHRSRGELDDDSEDSAHNSRRFTESTGSLQRQGGGVRSSKHIQLDDDIWGGGPPSKQQQQQQQQQWSKRPSSADRLSGSGGLSGSDGENDKRHKRKSKLPPKGKEVELRSNYATIRHPSSHHQRREYFDYDDEPNAAFEDELPPPPQRNISPRSQDQEYYGRRRGPPLPPYASRGLPRPDSRSFSEYSKPRYPDEEEYEAARKQQRGQFKKSTSRDLYVDDSRDYYQKPGFDDDEPNVRRQSNSKRMEHVGEEEEQQQQQRPPSSGQTVGGSSTANKFNFDGFESDFIASPKQSDQQKSGGQQKFSFESELNSPSPNLMNKSSSSQQRLRFSENVSVSKFDSNSSSQQMFEDDFAEWTAETPSAAGSSNIQSSLKKGSASNLKNNSVFPRHENLKKSDSVNIFARKSDEDPFENDDFFASEGQTAPQAAATTANNGTSGEHDPFQWSSKNNFANFDDNKNI